LSESRRVILGTVQFGDEPSLTPVVCLECAGEESARKLAALVLAIQNGERTMSGQDEAFRTGDVVVKVEVHRHPERPREAVLAVVHGRASEEHLTEAVYVSSTVEADPAQLFRFFQQTLRHYVLTVSVRGQPYCDLLYLVKHVLMWKSPVEARLP